jgi:hypothetical protein
VQLSMDAMTAVLERERLPASVYARQALVAAALLDQVRLLPTCTPQREREREIRTHTRASWRAYA